MARISTHVLDTSLGRPAEGIAIELHRGSTLLASAVTDPDGRTAEPLLQSGLLPCGVYTLTFRVGDYLAESFYETISISFTVRSGVENYHIPLLLSPYGYSTYRGS